MRHDSIRAWLKSRIARNLSSRFGLIHVFAYYGAAGGRLNYPGYRRGLPVPSQIHPISVPTLLVQDGESIWIHCNDVTPTVMETAEST